MAAGTGTCGAAGLARLRMASLSVGRVGRGAAAGDGLAAGVGTCGAPPARGAEAWIRIWEAMKLPMLLILDTLCFSVRVLMTRMPTTGSQASNSCTECSSR